MSSGNYVRSLAIETRKLPPLPLSRGGLKTRAFNTKDNANGLDDVQNLDAHAIIASPTGAIPEKLSAAVDAGSLLSFVDGISSQEREDILYSVQLASRGASAGHDRFNETAAWYAKYTEILEKLGWTTEQFAFTKYAQGEGELRMDQAALAVISAIATQNQLAVLKESLTALKGLAEDDGTIRLFDFHTTTQASGNFQIGAVQKSANGALSLALGAFHFLSDDQRRRFLFFSWGALKVQFWTAAQKLTLNTDHYSKLRDAVKEKLGLSAHEYIADLDIA